MSPGGPAVVVDPVSRQRFSFTRTTGDAGQEVLHVETWMEPGGGAGRPHRTAVAERFEILSGKPSFLVDGGWRTLSPGDVLDVPANEVHAYRNHGREPVHMFCHASPPSTLQEFIEDVAEFGRAGNITEGGALPSGLSGILEGAVMAHRHRHIVRILVPPLPEVVVHRVLLPALAWLGTRRGGGGRTDASGESAGEVV